MRIIRHLGLALFVVVASCSRSSSPTQRATAEDPPFALTNDLEIARANFGKLSNDLEILLAKGRKGHILMIREITLTHQQPSDSSLGARLVEVAADGETTIEMLETGQKLRAGTNQFFVSPEYGQKGLRVISASSERQEVQLERTWCE
jgi:hypothetical protein